MNTDVIQNLRVLKEYIVANNTSILFNDRNFAILVNQDTQDQISFIYEKKLTELLINSTNEATIANLNRNTGEAKHLITPDNYYRYKVSESSFNSEEDLLIFIEKHRLIATKGFQAICCDALATQKTDSLTS